MLRRLNRKTKGQSTAEYAILIGLVIAAAVAMQIYVKRGLQGRIHRAVQYMVDKSVNANVELGLGSRTQYEPYYLTSNFTVNRTSNTETNLDEGAYKSVDISNSIREEGGYQQYGYNIEKAD